MEREIDDKTILGKFAEDFCKVAEKYIRYIVCSGFVAIAHGRTRGTEDIDMIIEKTSKEVFSNLHNDLINHGFVCIQSDNVSKLFEYLEEGSSIRYVLDKKGFFPPEMEVKFAKDFLDEQQLKERVQFPLTGLDIYFSSIESNIAFKEELLKSKKDLEDAKHLRIVYEGEFDEDKINELKKQIKKLRLNER